MRYTFNRPGTIKRVILGIGLIIFLFGFTLAYGETQKNDPKTQLSYSIQSDGRVLSQGQEYKTISQYLHSPSYLNHVKRCTLKRFPGKASDLSRVMGAAADCSYALTTIKNEYWPSGVYTIPVVFHVITRVDGTGNLTDQQINEQIEVLNEDFRALTDSMGEQGYDTRVQFQLAGITRTPNNDWFQDLSEVAYKSMLQWDPTRYLNIYSNIPSDSNLGYSYLPQDGVDQVHDGVVVLYETVGGRNNGYSSFNQGRTVVHEVGHYLGLLHTFEGTDCFNGYDTGDLILDTNPESAPRFGCTQTYSCSLPDPIHNYMDYSDDACMHEFTREQANRIVCSIINYRPQLCTYQGNNLSAQIQLNRTKLHFSGIQNSPQNVTSSQQVGVTNAGSGTMSWTVSASKNWITLSPQNGTGDGFITVSVNTAGLAPGSYTGKLSVTSTDASNSPQQIPVTLKIIATSQDQAPFGAFSTPGESGTLRGSIPVTGWVLDDVEVKSVKIYAGDTYIGDSLFVDGARPDLELAYPNHPRNYIAGWGYMMLSNFLPGGGNGTYVLTARAVDSSGKETVLGTKTITVDNAHSVYPFGTIDTPGQGETVSGTNFINWGWALTPKPSSIPTNGTTMNVIIDSVNIGHPNYNVYREDIAQLFPGYNNSGGAAGYYSLDTTQYTNGLHTIQWTVTDSANHTEGIGSRYFTVFNNNQLSRQNRETSICPNQTPVLSEADLSRYDVSYNVSSSPIVLKRGLNSNHPEELLYPETKGINGKNGKNRKNVSNVSKSISGSINIRVKPLELICIRLEGKKEQTNSTSHYVGYLKVGNEWRTLPLGSTFDSVTSEFFWSPGLGFYGDYQLVFIETNTHLIRKINISVK